MLSLRVNDSVKSKLKQQFDALDPIALLHDIRLMQQVLSDMTTRGASEFFPQSVQPNLTQFLDSLATAWQSGEVRPTHRRKSATQRMWRTRLDPFEEVWSEIEAWLLDDPTATGKDLMDRLARTMPAMFASKKQLRTLQRRIMTWRGERAKDLIFGRFKGAPHQVQ